MGNQINCYMKFSFFYFRKTFNYNNDNNEQIMNLLMF